MKYNFIEYIQGLYKFINSPVDIISKYNEINKCKSCFDISNKQSMGEYYYKNILENKQGIVYTPYLISKYMIENTVLEEDIINNPFLKILDPACGTGNILLNLYKHLTKIYEKNIDEINIKHKLDLSKSSIGKHIINNNIYGVDIDENAIKILAIEIFHHSGIASENFIKQDYLADNWEESFDVIIGNPPYLGTKTMGRNYYTLLKNKYSEVFLDKSDISYCFFKKALESVKSNYKITFVTSRYFIESISGTNLRSYLLKSTYIKEMVDFYGERPFDKIGVDPVIIFLDSNIHDEILVKKPGNKINLKNDEYIGNMKKVYVKRYELESSPWRLQDERSLKILKKIESRCKHSLKDICTAYQGIITGCDKAFIVNREQIEKYDLERNLIKPWIKSKHIANSGVEKGDLYIIYSDLIDNPKNYTNSINYISNYKEKLENRRECRNGKRLWYNLQWGRKIDIFEDRKIIFPYKSASNKFIVDKSNFFSADIYAMKINSNVDMKYDILSEILNSYLYEFYFKCFGKKLGNNLYEYYPNNILRLKVPLENNIKTVEDLYAYFEITNEERTIVENTVDKANNKGKI